MTLIEEINSIKYLFLDDYKEQEENSIVFKVSEGIVGELEDFEFADNIIIEDTRPVTTEKKSRTYAIAFEDYVAFCIRNESYTYMDKAEEWEGRLLRIYTKSHFLDYVRRATFATDKFPGILRHYEIVCQFHVIDIITTVEPKIAKKE